MGIGVDDVASDSTDIDAHLHLAAWTWNVTAHGLADILDGRAVADVAAELLRHHQRIEHDVRTGRADEVRLALRVTSRLQRLLANNAVIVVDAEGQALQIGDVDVVTFDKPVWCRLLSCLASGALDNVAVQTDTLIAAGWPQEPLPPELAHARLDTALRELRAAGLAPHLTPEGDAWRLSALVISRS